MEQIGTCRVQGCPNQNEDNEIQMVKKMPHVRVLTWHKVPSNAVVRQLWGQLIDGITSRSYVCSNHFVDGGPTINNPHPTVYLNRLDINTKKANQVIEKWKRDHLTDHQEFVNETFHSKTSKTTLPTSSPAKRRKISENGEPSASPAKRTRLMDGESLTNLSPHVMESGESQNASSPSKPVMINKTLSQNTASCANTRQTGSTVGEDVMRNGLQESVVSTKQDEQVLSQSVNTKESVLVNGKEENRALHLQREGSSAGNDPSSANVVQSLSSSPSVSQPNITRKISEPDEPPMLEPQVNQPIVPNRSPSKSIPKLKIIDELAELKELLDKTLHNNQPDNETKYPPIENADKLKRKILNQSSDYPCVLLTRYPVPEGLDYRDNFSVKNAASLCSLKTLVGLPAKNIHTHKPPMPKTVTAQKANAAEDKVLTVAKGEVPYTPKTKDLDSDHEKKPKEVSAEVSITKPVFDITDNQPLSDLISSKSVKIISPQSEMQSSNEVSLSSKEEAGKDEDIQEIQQETADCETCAQNLVQIKSITSQMKTVKKQIKMVIRSNKEFIARNQKIDRELLIAQAHIKKLEAQNTSLKNALAGFGNNPGGQLVKTPDGRYFRLTPKQQAVSNQAVVQTQAAQRTLPSPAIINQPSQQNLINTAQHGVIQAQAIQAQMSNVLQQQPSLNTVMQPGQNVAQPQVFLRFGPSADNKLSMGFQVVGPTGAPNQQVTTNLIQGAPQGQSAVTVPVVQNTNLVGQQSVSIMPQVLNVVQQQPMVQQQSVILNGQMGVLQTQTSVPQMQTPLSQNAMSQLQSQISQGNAIFSQQKTKKNPSGKNSVVYAVANQAQPPPRPMPPLSVPKATNNTALVSKKCTVCQYLAREVQRLRKQYKDLNEEFQVMDKINTKIVDMFTPASPGFCALIGMELVAT